MLEEARAEPLPYNFRQEKDTGPLLPDVTVYRTADDLKSCVDTVLTWVLDEPSPEP